MLLSILHRMILIELARIFVLSLSGITGILVMAGVVAEATQHGLGAGQILAAIPLLIPSTLPYTIPATTLFATCLVYGRLAHDNEVLAVKAAGINVLYIVWPSMILGLAMSCVTMGFYYHLIPYTHHLLRTSIMKDLEEYMYALLKRDHCIRQPGLNYAIWVQQVQGKRLLTTVFKRIDENGNYDIVATAKEAYLTVDTENEQIVVHMRHGQVAGVGADSRGYFEDRTWTIPMPDMNGKKAVRPRAMDWSELLEQRSSLREEIENLNADIATKSASLMLTSVPVGTMPQHIEDLKQVKKQRIRQLDDVKAELQMRPALSASAFFFVLVGCPVGIWFSKSDYLSAFITCFLPIVFFYYPLMLCSTNFAKEGWNPILVIWAANGLLVLVAPILFYQLTKH